MSIPTGGPEKDQNSSAKRGQREPPFVGADQIGCYVVRSNPLAHFCFGNGFVTSNSLVECSVEPGSLKKIKRKSTKQALLERKSGTFRRIQLVFRSNIVGCG